MSSLGLFRHFLSLDPLQKVCNSRKGTRSPRVFASWQSRVLMAHAAKNVFPLRSMSIYFSFLVFLFFFWGGVSHPAICSIPRSVSAGPRLFLFSLKGISWVGFKMPLRGTATQAFWWPLCIRKKSVVSSPKRHSVTSFLNPCSFVYFQQTTSFHFSPSRVFLRITVFIFDRKWFYNLCKYKYCM